MSKEKYNETDELLFGDEDVKDTEDTELEEDLDEAEDTEGDIDMDDIEEDNEESNEVKVTNYQFEQLSSNLVLENKEIECDSIVLSNFKKISRKETLQGLEGLVRQWNVVAPIHVLALDDEDESLLSLDDELDEYGQTPLVCKCAGFPPQ